MASVIGPVGATAMGGLLVTSIAAGLAAIGSVRRFEVRERMLAETEEVRARA
jgi:hypothetical protein